MGITIASFGIRKLSDLRIDADLDMGAYNILIDALGLIDGKDVSLLINALSDLSIDADLDMGAYNITLGAAQTVDGVDVSALNVWTANTNVIKATGTNAAYTGIDISAVLGASKHAIIAFKAHGDAADGDGNCLIGVDSGGAAASIKEDKGLKTYNGSDTWTITEVRNSKFWWKCTSTVTLTMVGYILLG